MFLIIGGGPLGDDFRAAALEAGVSPEGSGRKVLHGDHSVMQQPEIYRNQEPTCSVCLNQKKRETCSNIQDAGRFWFC